MKKIIALALAALMALGLFACGETPNPDDKPTTAAGAPDPNEGTFAFDAATEGGPVRFAIGEDPTEALAALGEARNKNECASCAADATDITYDFVNYELTVTYPNFPDTQGAYLTGVKLIDDTVTTPEGAYIDCDKATVQELYAGYSLKEEGVELKYTLGRSTLAFMFNENNEAKQIQYGYLFDNA